MKQLVYLNRKKRKSKGFSIKFSLLIWLGNSNAKLAKKAPLRIPAQDPIPGTISRFFI